MFTRKQDARSMLTFLTSITVMMVEALQAELVTSRGATTEY